MLSKIRLKIGKLIKSKMFRVTHTGNYCEINRKESTGINLNLAQIDHDQKLRYLEVKLFVSVILLRSMNNLCELNPFLLDAIPVD